MTPAAAPSAPYDPALEALLEYLKRTRGFDFSGYKRPSLIRRIERRLQAVGAANLVEYLDYLEVHPDEFGLLFDTILINVTAFFRDPAAWKFIAEEIVPRIIASKATGESIRVWSAACASGEEAYTLAIVLAEALGWEQFRDRVKIYATDIDDESLNQARHGVYSARAVQNVPPDLLKKYFDVVGPDAALFTFRKDLRRALIFGRHDLGQDAPISRVDLLACRNALMYFNAEMQARILSRFHFALKDDGCLFLGKAEMLLTFGHLFTPVSLKQRIFARVPRIGVLGAAGPRSAATALTTLSDEFAPDQDEKEARMLSHTARLRDLAFDAGPVAEIVVDRQDVLTRANTRAHALFRLDPQKDVGRPLRDLEISYRPAELRSLIEQARTERRPASQSGVVWPHAGVDGTPLYLDVQAVPLADMGGALLGTSVTFTDVTRTTRLQQELEETNHELETTNEELQSTNEELETMNEELQSTNEELQNINEEVQQRAAQIARLNGFLGAILSSLRGAVVVLDSALVVDVWSSRAEDLWGLRADEARGKSFLTLDIGLPVAQLAGAIRDSLAGGAAFQEIVVAARNRLGRRVECRITATALTGSLDGAQISVPAATPRRPASRLGSLPYSDGANGAATAARPPSSGVILVMEPLTDDEEHHPAVSKDCVGNVRVAGCEKI